MMPLKLLEKNMKYKHQIILEQISELSHIFFKKYEIPVINMRDITWKWKIDVLDWAYNPHLNFRKRLHYVYIYLKKKCFTYYFNKFMFSSSKFHWKNNGFLFVFVQEEWERRTVIWFIFLKLLKWARWSQVK